MKLRPGFWALAFLLAAGGCGKPVLRLADASLGDYYTEKEFRKLTDEQRQEYCQELADQRETYESEIAEGRDALSALQQGIPSRRAEVDSLERVAAGLEARVSGARASGGSRPSGAQARGQGGGQAEPASSSLEAYTVKKGDSLWKISGLGELFGRSSEWGRLFQANRDRIHDPDRIYPGQELRIPR